MLRILCCLLLLIPLTVLGNNFAKLSDNEVNNAEYFLFDIRDHNVRVTSSLDAYILEGKTYIAVRPLLEALKIKYILTDTKLDLEFDGKEYNVELSPLTLGSNDYWFNDGYYTFLPLTIFEQIFDTGAVVNTNGLTINLIGHSVPFPYKKLDENLKQRQINQYLVRKSEENEDQQERVITVPDVYRLYTTPNGYASLNYSNNGISDNLTGVIQSVSDFAYHSTSLTLTKTENDLLSNVRLSRLPQYPGDKILGIWDTYSIGDIYSQSASFNNDKSRGLGVNFSANSTGGHVENFTTSFVKYGNPEWEVDIFHNGRFLETRVIPGDGVIELNNVEVYFGQNLFKLVMYGPTGEKEEILEEIDVRTVPLEQGNTSHGFSLLEYESSLFDINADEFDIDGASAYFNIGVLDNWNVGIRGSVSNIHSAQARRESVNINNVFSLPGWYLDNNIVFDENQISQKTSLATSFSYQDSMVLKYESNYLDDSTIGVESEVWNLSYAKRFDNYSNNLVITSNEIGTQSSQRITYSLSRFGRYFNLSNKFDYSVNDSEETLLGQALLTTRIGKNYRVNVQIPYDLIEQEVLDRQISTTLSYYISNESSRHNVSLVSRPLENDNSWNVSYNYSQSELTHQLTFGAQYDSNDHWRVKLGVVFGFGYDYYNNQLLFTRNNIHGGGTMDVHAYLDRYLNGIPDNLDYDLPNVSFKGGVMKQPAITNNQGQARLFGASTGISSLSSSWEFDGRTLNQDYLVYSHPGSQHYINLPYYLTTELEMFVLLDSNNATLPLSSVPILARNLSTGDEYSVDSDSDGYVNFDNIMPGRYQLNVDEMWLKDRGFVSQYSNIEFDTPLEGGFVVLPELYLFAEDNIDKVVSGGLKIKLNEDNHVANQFDGNDKLVHLPPEGAVKAPHSLEFLDDAFYKKIKHPVNAQHKKALRERLNKQREKAFKKAQNVNSTKFLKTSAAPQSNEMGYKLLLGSFADIQSAIEFASQNGFANRVEQGLNFKGELIYRVALDVKFDSKAAVNEFIMERFSSLEAKVVEDKSTEPLLNGWVVQYLAVKDYKKALEQVSDFSDVMHLNIAIKEVNGEMWYCLISRTFFDKAAAVNYLKTAKEDGFVLQAQNYQDIIWSKQ